jgi:hypothetical protein
VVAVGETLCVPLTDSVPLQPPLAVHEEAFEVVHFRVDEPPDEIDVELAVNATVAAGTGAAASTVTFVDVSAVPAELVH